MLCLQETLLTARHTVNIANYNTIIKRSNNADMRGVITAVRPDIPFTINDFVNIGIPDHHVCDITIHLKKLNYAS